MKNRQQTIEDYIYALHTVKNLDQNSCVMEHTNSVASGFGFEQRIFYMDMGTKVTNAWLHVSNQVLDDERQLSVIICCAGVHMYGGRVYLEKFSYDMDGAERRQKMLEFIRHAVEEYCDYYTQLQL